MQNTHAIARPPSV